MKNVSAALILTLTFARSAGAFDLSATDLADMSAAQTAAQSAQIQNLVNDSAQGYDFSTLSQSSIQSFTYCNTRYTPDLTTSAGHQIKMLATALVYASPSNGKSIFGHVGERFVYCRDSVLFDVLYDYAPFDPTGLNAEFESTYGVDLAQMADTEKSSILNSLFVRLNYNPPAAYDEGQFLEDQSFYEAWFHIDAQTMYKMLVANTDRYLDQTTKIKLGQPLPPYQIFADDCMTPVKSDLKIINPNYLKENSPASLTPGYLFSYVEGHDVDKIIIYPSQRLTRILRERAEGKSTAFDWFLPTSHESAGFLDSWALVYAESRGVLKYTAINPVSGALNFGAGLVETAYGIATIPTTFLGRLFHIRALESDKEGMARVRRGISDMLASTFEAFSLQVRYPQSDAWTPEENEFFRNFSQHAVLLDYLNSKYLTAPLIVRTSALTSHMSETNP